MAPRKKIKSEKEEHTLSVPMPDWSRLPQELLNLISKYLEDSYDAAIHARAVCNPWQSVFSYPSSVLSRTTYSLPSFATSSGFCTLENFPVFLFIHRDRTSLQSEFLIGGIVRDDHVELPSTSHLQSTVKVKMPWYGGSTSISICNYQIVSLGRQYAMVGYDLNSKYRGVAFLPLTKKGGGEFVVLVGYSKDLLVLTSAEMKWKRLEHRSMASCSDIVTFRGKFYALLLSGELFVIDPYSLEMTPLMPPPSELENFGRISILVPSGDDGLFLVEKFIPRNTRVLHLFRLACRVSRLDEETGEWVIVSDLGDRVLLIGPPGNRTCSGKDLPDGCGLSGNSILFTGVPGGIVYPFNYGVDTRHEEDDLDLNYWRPTEQNRVTILSASPIPAHMKSPVVALRVEH